MSSFFIPSVPMIPGSSNVRSLSATNVVIDNQFIKNVTIEDLIVNDINSKNITNSETILTSTINGIVPQAHAQRHAFDGHDPLTPAEQSDITELSDYFPSAGTNELRIPRADHRHAHGNRGGGLLHAEATQSSAGFMSATDKSKLDNLPQDIIGTTGQININPSGSDLQISIANNVVLPGTGSVALPKGTNAQRSGAPGSIRFNTQSEVFETTSDGSIWSTIQTSGTGVNSVAGTSGRILVDPTTLDVVVDIDPGYEGQSSITTVGMLQSGSLGSGFDPIIETLGGTGQTGYTLGDLLYASGSDTLSKLSGNVTASKQYLSQTGTGSVSSEPQWSTISGSDITGSALTKTDDTNVTLTLGGTPSTALLQPVSLGVGWTGTLAPSRGGTGLSSVNQGDILYASGSNTITTLSKNTSTSRYLSNTGTSNNPSWSQINLSDGVSGILPSTNGGTGVNNGSRTLTLGGNLTTSGAFNSTFTMTGATAVTFPTSGTLATTSQLPTGSALTKTDDTNVTLTLGGTPSTALLQATSITAGWTGTLAPSRGGTGVNNGSRTLTLGGNLTTSGAFNSTFTMTGATAVTFPTSGTLATTSQLPTPSALTKTDDTNVTLTLGGTPTTALLQPTSITAGWTGTLAPSRGGTGLGTTPTNGQLLIGNGSGYTLNTLSATNGLSISNGAGTTSIGFSASVTVTYLVVGGGGPGGNGFGGGGGGGGVIASSQTINSGTLSITVGNGGIFSNGQNSTLSGPGTGMTTVTALGGGYGGGQGIPGNNGGSGGGGTVGAGSAGGTGTVGQGNNGGTGQGTSGGGGGGAGSVGSNAPDNATGGAGGNGVSSSITGSSVTYGGGGGGSGSTTPGSGGSGGGGAGSTSGAGTNGTANRGGGGGGTNSISFSGGSGGSGIVIVSVPTVYYGGFTGTGSASVVSSNTVVSFTSGSGTLIITSSPGSSGVYIPNNVDIDGNLDIDGTLNVTNELSCLGQRFSRYESNSTQNIPNNSTATLTDFVLTYNIGTAFPVSSGEYTLPIGYYIVTCVITLLSNAGPTGGRILLRLDHSVLGRLSNIQTTNITGTWAETFVSCGFYNSSESSISVNMVQGTGATRTLSTASSMNILKLF